MLFYCSICLGSSVSELEWERWRERKEELIEREKEKVERKLSSLIS